MASTHRIKGTSNDLFKVGFDAAQLKKSGLTRMSVQNDGDSALANMEGADPALAQDFVTKAYGDLTYLGGGGTITTTNINWVDKAGNDGTALPNRVDLPYLTIEAALTASASGDAVIVRPGAYTESALSIGTGVSLIGEGGFGVTEIGDATAVVDIITLQTGSYLQGFGILLPSVGAGVGHSVGTGTVYDLDLRGDGATGTASGIHKTGTGKIVGGNIRCETGGMANMLHVASGVLALDDVHVPQSAGTISNVVLTQGTARFQGQGLNIGSTNVVDCIHVEGTSTCIIYSPNWGNATIGGHIAADGVTVMIVGGLVDAIVATLLVDPALTGVGTTITVSGTTIQPLFSFPSAAIGAMALSAQIHQIATATRDSEVRVLGSSLVCGFPEVGSGFMVGEGSAYSDRIKVVTSDGTATSVAIGGNLTDVTVDAQTIAGSTFGFQALTAGHCIYFASTRTSPTGTDLKHWGTKVHQIIAGVGGSYVAEIWDGAAWVAFGVMATSQGENYRYGNSLFLRAAGHEFLQYGLTETTTWVSSAVDGVTAYWVRWRIATTVTTGPTFERAWVTPSHTMLNAKGQRRALGLATWKKTIVSAGNVFGESGGVPTAKFDVGSGGVPTGWEHQSPNSLLDASGNAIYAQFALPGGICTAFPLTIEVIFSFQPGGTLTSPVIGFVSAIPIQTAFNIVADPAGGLVPIQRAITDTENMIAKPATSYTFDSSAITTVWPADTLYKGSFGPYDIANYYSEDAVLVRMELDDDGTPAQNVAIIALIVKGIAFTDGEV